MFCTDVLPQWNLGTLAMLFYNTYKSEQEDLGLKQKDNPCCSVEVIIPPNGAGNDLWIFPVKPIRWKKIINSHNVHCVPNRHLIAFSSESYCSAPHFTLRFCDSINALCSTCGAPPWASAGNWIGVSACCNTRWSLLTTLLVCFFSNVGGEHTCKKKIHVWKWNCHRPFLVVSNLKDNEWRGLPFETHCLILHTVSGIFTGRDRQ